MTDHGPLQGLRVVEFAGIGPAPFAAMLLSDLGAQVVRIDRPGEKEWPEVPIVSRGRAALTLDLKEPEDLATCKLAVSRADMLVEGFRPGVMERLGLGPEAVLQLNRRVIYGRITGWGADGPLAQAAGHDINYVALTGALYLLGRPADVPVPPLNLLGDYAGGSLYLVMGMLAALFERERSGLGQVVNAAIVDGVASLLGPVLGMQAAGIVNLNRGANLLGGAQAPHYRCYRCRDGQYLAIGALEARFRAQLCEKLGLAPDALARADDPNTWGALTSVLADIFATRSREEWEAIFRGSDACVAPVLSPDEAFAHSQMRHRQTWVTRHGLSEPSPAPRLSRTPTKIQSSADGREVLRTWE
jgi:alpha-methylacyl-CoA racemase